MRWLGLWAVALVCFACSQVGSVSQEEVQGYATRTDAPLLIDVRSTEEYRSGHVAGAIHIPHTEIAARLAEVRESDPAQVVVYCQRGWRAGVAATVLQDAGFEVSALAGHMKAWRAAGLPVVHPKDKAR